MKRVRNSLADRYQLQPGVLCPNGTLEAIAAALPVNLEALAGVSGVRSWQVNEIGAPLLEAMQSAIVSSGEAVPLK